MKEIHFYTNICNKNQISDEEISNVLIDYVSTNNAINDGNINIIRTTQLCFLRDSLYWYTEKNWKIYIHNGDDIIEVKTGEMKGTDKEIRKEHSIERLFIGGTFGEVL